MTTIKQIINSDDPLSNEAIEFLLAYHEENTLVDYKLTCDLTNEKFWIDITKDIMAFANTNGGYIVIGVKDLTYEIKNLELSVLKIMQDSNNILQKVNKYIEPHITQLRSKVYSKDSKDIIVMFIPESLSQTHIFTKDGNFIFVSKKPGCAFHKGTLYVRRSGGNHLVDSRDFDDLVQKRINTFRESILGKIAKVVRAPQNTEVLFVTRESDADDKNRFIIEDSSDALAVKGMSFSVSPKTIEEEIASWIALHSSNNKALPPPETVWTWYQERDNLECNIKQKCKIVKLSLLCEVPAFYWLKDCPAQEIKEMLFDLLLCDIVRGHYSQILCIANFLGATTFGTIVKKIGKKNMEHVARRYKKYLKEDIFSIVDMGCLRSSYKKKSNESWEVSRNNLLQELNSLVKAHVESRSDVIRTFKIRALDCFLYAREDKYQITK